VALRTVRAPTQVMLKVLAGYARALLEYVARYRALLLLLCLCICGARRDDRLGPEEARRFGKVGRRCGRTVSREGRGIRYAEGMAVCHLGHVNYLGVGEA
jgi:hypothetical protein